MSDAAARRIGSVNGNSSSPRHRLGPSHFPAVRPFSLRFALATTAPHHRRRKRRLDDARHRSPNPIRRLRGSRSRSTSSVVVPGCFRALRPFVLRFILATGASAPCRRRKASVVDMGNHISRLLGKSTSWVEGSGEVGDLTVANKGEEATLEVVTPFYKDAKKRNGRLVAKLPKGLADSPKEDLSELFTPLTNEEESEVNNILYGSGHSSKILVRHEPSNIEITKEKLWCLRPCGWLNDEVINLYLELLKERAERESKRFVKCHFFNTFFYKKLTCGKTGYDYQSVRRWTTLKKLGYGLMECEKIFVPIHRDTHWCLAVINMKDRTFQYLDSLGGTDCAVLRILARYIMDELKDKSNVEIDTTSWLEISDPLPLQQNGWDCGIFMLKFIDFHSRGLGMCFGQEHMEYFRKRTAKEILRLRAD